MDLKKYLSVSPEVQQAIAEGKPVVALESTIISHGMPYPQNVETALSVERIIRENGAVPATIAIIGGRLKAGLTPEEIEYFGKKGQAIHKASRRDLAAICARGEDGATTVATTMIIAHMAGIKIFATGGIGGVHRGAEVTMDISADLEELAQTPVMVVCAGAKSILDLGLTLEYLETKGVPVLGYGTEESRLIHPVVSHQSLGLNRAIHAERLAKYRTQSCGSQQAEGSIRIATRKIDTIKSDNFTSSSQLGLTAQLDVYLHLSIVVVCVIERPTLSGSGVFCSVG